MVNIVKGDFGFDINFTATDANSDAVNLTNSTITLKMRLLGGTLTFLSGACVIDNASAGTCHYAVQDGDMNTVGRYQYELEIASSGKLITATDSERIIILDTIV